LHVALAVRGHRRRAGGGPVRRAGVLAVAGGDCRGGALHGAAHGGGDGRVLLASGAHGRRALRGHRGGASGRGAVGGGLVGDGFGGTSAVGRHPAGDFRGGDDGG